MMGQRRPTGKKPTAVVQWTEQKAMSNEFLNSVGCSAMLYDLLV